MMNVLTGITVYSGIRDKTQDNTLLYPLGIFTLIDYYLLYILLLYLLRPQGPD